MVDSERVINLDVSGVSRVIVRCRENIESRIVVVRRLTGSNIRWLFVMLSLCMKVLNEHLLNGAYHS